MANNLKQQMGLFSAVMVVISAMIGSGVFKKITGMSFDLQHSGWVLLAWIAAGLITLMGSLSNAEVAGLIAKPGGQYVYFQTMYGKLFAFLFGWASFTVIQTATAVSVAFVFAESLSGLLPSFPQVDAELSNYTLFSLAEFKLQPFNNLYVKLITIGLVILLSAINYCGISYGEKIGNILGGTVVIGISMIIILSFAMGKSPSLITSVPGGNEVTPALFFSAMLAAFWAYEGWNNVGFLGGEIKDPKRNIPLALGIGTLIVMVLYVTVNASYFKTNDINFYVGLKGKVNSIAAVESMNSLFMYGGLCISLLILVSTFNSSNNSLMTAPRIYYAMANDGLFFKSAASTHSKYLTPHKAIIYQMFWCIVLVISGSFDMLTELLVFVAFIFYGCGAFGVIVLRKKMPDAPRPFKVPFYPVIPVLFSMFSAFLVYYTIQDSPGKAAIGLGLVALGVPVYYFFGRTKKN